MSEFTNKDVQKYAWDYFAVHASQRMSLFNFFVIFSSLVTTGLVGTFQEAFRAYPLGFGFGMLLVLISFIFWKLDQRVGFLIKHAEAALKHVESQFPDEGAPGAPHVTQLFTLEEYLTNQMRKSSHLPWRWHLTYSRCFKVAYLAFALIGIVGACVSLVLLIR
jgi:hypothetical protein